MHLPCWPCARLSVAAVRVAADLILLPVDRVNTRCHPIHVRWPSAATPAPRAPPLSVLPSVRPVRALLRLSVVSLCNTAHSDIIGSSSSPTAIDGKPLQRPLRSSVYTSFGLSTFNSRFLSLRTPSSGRQARQHQGTASVLGSNGRKPPNGP